MFTMQGNQKCEYHEIQFTLHDPHDWAALCSCGSCCGGGSPYDVQEWILDHILEHSRGLKPTYLQKPHHLTLGDSDDEDEGDLFAICSCGESCSGFPYGVHKWVKKHIRKYSMSP